MKAGLRQEAIELRTGDRLSYSEIQRRLNVPKSTLSYWLREYPLDEAEIVKLRHRAWLKGETSRERFRNAMQRKREQLEQEAYYQQRKRLIGIKKERFVTKNARVVQW
ncbi:MAG: helix-turn-helix domain-containing protein [Patescibacteria group bacterium]|nr:helix-turn-helix domain-containing protein [Patescibacteria group bacterium]MCL5224045.1 helix-turn-helix domain-containing protein [Patescibacteria group bacterium]